VTVFLAQFVQRVSTTIIIANEKAKVMKPNVKVMKPSRQNQTVFIPTTPSVHHNLLAAAICNLARAP